MSLGRETSQTEKFEVQPVFRPRTVIDVTIYRVTVPIFFARRLKHLQQREPAAAMPVRQCLVPEALHKPAVKANGTPFE
jgi:hypothetical protein